MTPACRGAVVILITTFTLAACSKHAPTTARLVAVMPPDGAFGRAPAVLANDLDLLTDGSLAVDVVSPAEAGIEVAAVFDLVDGGDIDMAIAPPAAFELNGKQSPIGPLLVSGLPFGFKAHEFLAWYFGAGGEGLVQDIYDRRSANGNVLLLPLVLTTSEPPGFFIDPVPSDADEFNDSGITYRMNMLGAEVMKTAFPGITIVSSPPGVVPVDDLCEGRIHGAELGTLSVYQQLFIDRFSHENGENIVECGFRHLYLSGWQQPMLSNWLLVNKTFLERLPPDEQHAIRTSAMSQLSLSLSSDLARNMGVVDAFVAAGVTVHSALPSAVLDRLRTATVSVIERNSASDSDFKLIVESMREFAIRNHTGLLYDGIAPDQRFSQMPGWSAAYDIRSD
ncbi:MAG: hypothetical protein AAF660_07615 [Pseudomonadota bacterium]